METKTASPPDRRTGRRAGLLLLALIVVQFFLFREYARRAVTPFPEAAFDQTAYLRLSIDTYEAMQKQGLWGGIWEGLARPVPNGLLLHVQGGLTFLVFGPSRESALLLNFAYLALLQVCAFRTLRWATGRTDVAWAGLGLLLTATTCHYGAGDLYDFRIDFIAFCLYGVFLCAVVRSDFFRSIRWSALAGLGAVYLALFRLVTYPWLTVLLGLLLVYLLGRWWVGGGAAVKRRLVGLLVCGAVFQTAMVPVLVAKYRVIHDYYIVNHLQTGEKDVRAREYGVHDLGDHLLFYPRSVVLEHAGPTFLVAGAAALVAGIVLALAVRRGRSETVAADCRLSDPVSAWVFPVLALFTPVAVMTAGVSKSPLTGNVGVMPLFWLLVTPLVLGGSAWRRRRFGRLGSAAMGGLAVALIAVGVSVRFNANTQQRVWPTRPEDAAQALALADEVSAYCRDTRCLAPVISSDTPRDYLGAAAIGNRAYFQHGLHLNVGATPLGGSILRIEPAVVRQSLDQSDVIITTTEGPDGPDVWPAVGQMREVRPLIQAYCAEHCLFAGEYQVLGNTHRLYLRPRATPQHRYPDWLTREGLSIAARGKDLRQFPRVEMTGEASSSLDGTPRALVEARFPDGSTRSVPAMVYIAGGKYTIRFGLEAEQWPADGTVTFQVRFDRWFVPRALGINDDERELVVRTPREVRLVR